MCVLIVEDEELIRNLLADELDFHGHEVCEACHGDHAATLIENSPKAFSLLITDIHMPGRRNGIEVARMVRQHYPLLPIIFTTGRPDAVAAWGPPGLMEAVVLKPYTPSIIMAVVQQLLNRPCV